MYSIISYNLNKIKFIFLNNHTPIYGKIYTTELSKKKKSYFDIKINSKYKKYFINNHKKFINFFE
jgi:hypothetical protein